MNKAHFEGETVFVVGGSSGIGLATAKQLAREGAKLVLLALPEGLAEARESVRQAAADADVRAFAVDVTSAEQTEAVLTHAVAECGVPRLVIHCVGRALPRPFATLSDAQFDQTLKVNLYGAFHVLRVLVPMMRARGGGQVALISSLLGLFGMYGYSDYCASKFGLIGLAEVLRGELEPDGIGVSVLCPGDTDTPGFREENCEKPAATTAISRTGGLAQPEEVAAAFVAGLRAGRFLIFARTEHRLLHLAKRFLPRLFERVMRKRIHASLRAC